MVKTDHMSDLMHQNGEQVDPTKRVTSDIGN